VVKALDKYDLLEELGGARMAKAAVEDVYYEVRGTWHTTPHNTLTTEDRLGP
jgi:hypothetical protein